MPVIVILEAEPIVSFSSRDGQVRDGNVVDEEVCRQTGPVGGTVARTNMASPT